MRNFSTNQVRHFFVAGAVDANLDTNLDIYFKSTETGECFFEYKNADGIITRSDTFHKDKVKNVNKVAAANLAIPLMAHTITVDSSITLSSLVGKDIICKISFIGLYDGSGQPQLTFNATFKGNSTNTASAAAFHKDLAYAIAQALPQPDKNYPLLKVFSNGTEVTSKTAYANITGATAGVVLVEAKQKYVRGKLDGTPVHFNVVMTYEDGQEFGIWGKDVVAASAISGNTVIPGYYTLADMEYFCLGERGDVYRGFHYPNDFTPTYAIDISGNTSYDMLTISYFWNGDASDVQKSPKVMHIVGPAAAITSLYNSVMAVIENGGSGSGSGA